MISPGTIRLERGKSRLYPPMAAFATLNSITTTAGHALIYNKLQEEHAYSEFGCRYVDFAVGVPSGFAVVALAINNVIGDFVELAFREDKAKHHPKPSEVISFKSAQFSRIYQFAIFPIFIAFFEDHRPWLEDKVGKDPYQWPHVLNFARVIRNCMTHGSVKFKSEKAAAVSWKGMILSPQDNNTNPFVGGLEIGDILVLIIEMAAELDSLGCPIEPI